MASSSSSAIPFCQNRGTRFLNPWKNQLYKWSKKNNNDSAAFGLTHLHHPHPHPLNPTLSLRHRLLLPRPPLSSLCRPHSPPFRPSLSSMTTPPQATSDSTQSTSTKTVRIVIKGRVQGVFYRDWTVENANQLGLKGWVRNRRDGSVEALFSGNPDSVQEMEQRCRRGPPSALVTGFEVFPSTDDPGTRFERKQTV
ncbi:Acylphosphatase [Parasponia andersonii]|uniref:acylphosphatase n=1 Tax=Parasponia andersonii TaxID=3476 RepID=A0A2P5CH11_PARAD|nr:Acylphosphatase [Parasponia andersonii]